MGPKEFKDMMNYLTRPRMAEGERIMLSNGGIAEELNNFVQNFKRVNGRIPTQNEIIKGTGRASKTIKSYLTEGQDFAKPLTKKEAAKLGGRKRPASAVLEVSDDLVDQFKNLKFTHISPTVDTTAAGSKKFRVLFSGPIANDFKEIYVDATEENLRKIANQLDDIVASNTYKNKAKQFKTPEQLRKLRNLKDAMYRKKDPYSVYENLRKYKAKIFPGDASMDIQIQHGQPKFSTQTLSRMGFIPKQVNISPEVEKVERIRNERLATVTKQLKNKNISIGDKKNLIDEFNNTMKGLRGQLKGTGGQGLVNFELLDIDQDGNVTKLKDTGFDPKRGLVASDEDLSKITKERADELIKLGKQKIDAEAVRLNLIPASKLAVPEKTKTRNMFKDFDKRTKLPTTDGPTLGMNLGLFKGFGEALRAVPTPLGTVGATAGFGVDPTSAIDRATIATEAALAPELVKQSARFGPVAQRIFNLGLNPATALRVARFASPIGIASLGLEGLYNVGKLGLEDQRRFEALSPEEQRAERAGQEEFARGIEGAREGGIIGKKSGPPPTSGFTPHGLPGLLKRGTRT